MAVAYKSDETELQLLRTMPRWMRSSATVTRRTIASVTHAPKVEMDTSCHSLGVVARRERRRKTWMARRASIVHSAVTTGNEVPSAGGCCQSIDPGRDGVVSDRNSFDLMEVDLVVRSVVEFGRTRPLPKLYVHWSIAREPANWKTARANAVQAEQREAELRQRAEKQGEDLRRNLYLAQMKLAGQAAASPSGIGRIRERLTPWDQDQPDLHAWEWYHLLSLCSRDLATMRAHALRCAGRGLEPRRPVASVGGRRRDSLSLGRRGPCARFLSRARLRRCCGGVEPGQQAARLSQLG